MTQTLLLQVIRWSVRCRRQHEAKIKRKLLKYVPGSRHTCRRELHNPIGRERFHLQIQMNSWLVKSLEATRASYALR
ncbi:hypothetical protein QTG54_005701 [Skeletonema marinoi]|uniref:Uncharacterized protein n=1 Tax=Skeletonema marinoi TaxID=267567 RepID=A0AAD9DFC6_9STRA|nr:hypothetical protein QTG54_005701 [Skeletonema marinoi]